MRVQFLPFQRDRNCNHFLVPFGNVYYGLANIPKMVLQTWIPIIIKLLFDSVCIMTSGNPCLHTICFKKHFRSNFSLLRLSFIFLTKWCNPMSGNNEKGKIKVGPNPDRIFEIRSGVRPAQKYIRRIERVGKNSLVDGKVVFIFRFLFCSIVWSRHIITGAQNSWNFSGNSPEWFWQRLARIVLDKYKKVEKFFFLHITYLLLASSENWFKPHDGIPHYDFILKLLLTSNFSLISLPILIIWLLNMSMNLFLIILFHKFVRNLYFT